MRTAATGSGGEHADERKGVEVDPFRAQPG